MKVCLYQPTMAGNLGTIIRFLACMGSNEIDIIMPTGFPFNAKEFKRSVMDYGDNFDIHKHDNFDEYIKQNQGKRIILASTKSSDIYYDFKFREDDILLFGSEVAGVPDDVHEKSDARIRIEMKNNHRSLNLAVSVAVIYSEGIRQLSIS
jgi:tRNA (cytidine/uridine-2'-O-)-methyltransferase